MDLINFKVGYKTISLKILDILLTEQFNNNLTVLPNDNKSFLGVKDYMGIPTPVFDLGIILNGVSTEHSNRDALKQLKSWQKQLNTWFNQLEQALLSSQNSLNTSQCELADFEQFYMEFKTDNDELKSTMSRFNEPFKSLLQKVEDTIKVHKQKNSKQVLIQLEIVKRHELIQLERLFESAKEQTQFEYSNLAVVVLDLDHFKGINDAHGHDVGDCILKGFSAIIKAVISDQSYAFRTGGEEFCLICPNTTLEQATALAESIRSHADDQEIEINGSLLGYSVSCGVAASHEQSTTFKNTSKWGGSVDLWGSFFFFFQDLTPSHLQTRR